MASNEPLSNVQTPQVSTKPKVNYFREFTAGLTVSFAAMSLGAAFGDASNRGPLKGALSAGVLALITSAIGGTRVQCSGPTAPMTAVTTIITAYALNKDDNTQCSSDFLADFPDNDCNLFVNMTIVLAGIMLILLGVCQVGKLITIVPNVVISGFMNGIAVMVWIPQIQALFGWGKEQMEGHWAVNTVLACLTTFIIFNFPKLTGRFCPAVKAFLPGTLVAMVLVTAFVALCGAVGIEFIGGIKKVQTGDPIDSMQEVGALFTDNFPSEWSGGLIVKALPYAFQLAMLGYIDTLLTTLIVDVKVEDKYKEHAWRPTNKMVELLSQGIANAACALFGGIPGAQATIRSVLILNEGAMTQMAGCIAGLLTIIEMAALQSLVSQIPQCVLTGVLFKVGYDCFDWIPVFTYINTQILRKEHPGATDPSRASEPIVPHSNMIFIVLTCVANSFFALYIVVGVAVVLYYVVNMIMKVPDLVPYNEQAKATEAADAENVLA